MGTDPGWSPVFGVLTIVFNFKGSSYLEIIFSGKKNLIIIFNPCWVVWMDFDTPGYTRGY